VAPKGVAARLGGPFVFPASSYSSNISMQETNPAWLISQAPKDLKAQIHAAVLQGFTVASQTKTTAQLIRPKKFSCLFATLWLFVFGIGFLIYLFYYLSKKDDAIYLDITTQPSKEEIPKVVYALPSSRAILMTIGFFVGVCVLFGLLIRIATFFIEG
jgi:hypothetical protein